jgi:hypothetical protein
MLSPWIQRTLANQPVSTETGQQRQISLSGGHTDRLLNKVQRQTAESQVWQPDIGSLKPDFVERFATNIVERFPATDTKYAAQPLTSASSEPANLVLVGGSAQPVSHAEEPGTQSQSSSSETENWPTLADLQRAVEAKARWTPPSSSPSPPPTPVQRTTARPAQSSQPAPPSPPSPPRPRRIFSRVEEVTPSGATSIRTRSSGQESGESESVQKKEDTAPTAADHLLAAPVESEAPPSGPNRPDTPPLQRQPDQPRPIPQPRPEAQPAIRSAPDKPEAQSPPTLQPTGQPLPPDRLTGSSVQRQPDQPEPSPGSRKAQVEEMGVVRAEDLPASITDPDQPGPAVEPESGASQAAETSTSPPLQRMTGQKPPVQAELPLSATRPEREVTTSEPPQSVQRQPGGEKAPQTKLPPSLSGEAGPDRSEIASLPDRETELARRPPGEEVTAGSTEETLSSQAAGKPSPQTVQRQVEQGTSTSKQIEAPEPDRPERLLPASRAEQSEPPLENEVGVVPSKETSSSRLSPETPSTQAVQRQSEASVDEVEVFDRPEGPAPSRQSEAPFTQALQRQSELDVPSVQPAEIKPDRPESPPPSSKGDQPEAPVGKPEVLDRLEGPIPSRRSEAPPRQAVQRQPEPDVPPVQPAEIKPGRAEPSSGSEGAWPEASVDKTHEVPQATTAQETEFVRPERPTGEVDQPGRRPTEQPSSPEVQRQPDESASVRPLVAGAAAYIEPTQPERPAPGVEDRPEPESQAEAGSAQAVQRRVDRTEVDQFEAVRPQVEGMEEVQPPPAQTETQGPERGETESSQQPEAPASSETGPMIPDADADSYSYGEAGLLRETGPDVSQRAEIAPGVQRHLDSELPVEAEPSSPVPPTEPDPLPVPPRSEGETVQAKPSVDDDIPPAQLETSTREPGRETQSTSSTVQRRPEPTRPAPAPSPSPEPVRPQLPEVETVLPESPVVPASRQEPEASASIEAGDLSAESPAQSHPAESPVQRQPDEAGTSRPGLEEDILARASSKANLPLAKPMSPASRFKSGPDSSRNGAESGASPSSQGQVQARFENGAAEQPEATPLILNRFRPPASPGTISEVGRSELRSGGIQRTVSDPFPAPRDLPLPPVQRTPATDQSAEVVQRSDTSSETGAATGAETGASGQDLDKLAREVYPIIKRLLAVERERDTGLLRRR